MSSSDDPTLGERLVWGVVLLALVCLLASCRLAPTEPCEARRVVLGRDTLRAVCGGPAAPVPTSPTAP